MRMRPLVVDALIAAALTTVAVLLGQESVRQGWPALDATGYALVALANLPAVLRGKAPLAVLLFIHSVWIVYVTAGYWPVLNTFAPMLALYTVASLRPARVSLPCAVLLGAAWIYAGLVTDGSTMTAVVAQAIGFPLVIWRFGYAARRTAELARQLKREQDERARREVAEERGRIARELHDVVAHHMSVISVQAGLATFVFGSDPATARAALGTIAGTSGEALEELRRMLRVLRAEEPGDGGDGDGTGGDGPAAPMPGLARLGEMVERVRAGGVPVELRVTGTPRPLAPGIELCAYRVVQEALTNVLKHAHGASSAVELVYRERHIEVSVSNDGQGVIQDRVRTGSGHGLIGMRERAKLYGGTISIGPLSEGGFAVRLTLPTSARAEARGDDGAG
ncbi:two-component sensor histidine kinase [Streptomyces sp. WAC 01529]|uniref:sensor histidine kinase n=1 Tax=Streptomyces sp. WAC 01529 TaxID=2203205 RepID=UPI000F6C7F1F|nr:sensor histidine kinase [Streptomyces sp. WAC 01529]AZM54992.1 two-component sensor histidine kinase [Streptomyces sp. WAC 01529]